jgi:hypothetical protein
MKNLIILMMSLFAVEVVAFSGVVTDLKSYTYYTAQIKNQVDMIDQQTSMLKKAAESVKLAEKTKKSLEGAYSKAKRQAESILYDIERAKEDPLNAAIDIEDSLSDSDPKKVREQINKHIDDTYKYETTSPWQRNDKAKAEAQKSVKRLMVLSEESTALSAYNLKELQSLIEAANASETQKEATDVTNAILTEMLKNQNRIIDMMAAFQTTFAKLHYDGETEDNAAESSKSDTFKSELGEYLKVDPQDLSNQQTDRLKSFLKNNG